MPKKTPWTKSLWFSVLMSIVSLAMLAEYARLVLTVDDSLRRVVVMVVWLVMALAWIAISVVRARARRTPG